MALTRKMLKAMGIEDEKIDQIIEAHTETTDALKQQRDEAKAEAADDGKAMTDGHRAFCMGNALAVGVSHAIGKQIARDWQREHDAKRFARRKIAVPAFTRISGVYNVRWRLVPLAVVR